MYNLKMMMQKLEVGLGFGTNYIRYIKDWLQFNAVGTVHNLPPQESLCSYVDVRCVD